MVEGRTWCSAHERRAKACMANKIFFIFLFLFFLNLSSCSNQNISQNNLNNPDNLKKAVSLNIQLGFNYFNLKHNNLAREKFQKALDLNPNSPSANSAMGYFLWKVGDLNSAQNFYNKAYLLAPKDPDVLNARGVFLCETANHNLNQIQAQAQIQEAVSDFLTAAKTPGFLAVGVTYQNAGSCVYQYKNLKNNYLKQAQIYFQKALLEDNLLPLADLRLAEIYFEQKDLKQAQIYLNKFNDIADPVPESVDLEKRLKI